MWCRWRSTGDSPPNSAALAQVLYQILKAVPLYRLNDHSWVGVDVCSPMPDALHDLFTIIIMYETPTEANST
ncbi:hypothetical protein LAZ67_1002279 [Cordylochernes scorpioides]|uniref:Uncharacterized protein n=1 Tax=Cordylochernes scorpioides TaxID=51811 RepID=A0ABY6K0R7_9ARAC|nr:hypothetical protein LAZ67_1002279 [Cordylochernes scorpioides]